MLNTKNLSLFSASAEKKGNTAGAYGHRNIGGRRARRYRERGNTVPGRPAPPCTSNPKGGGGTATEAGSPRGNTISPAYARDGVPP